MTSHLPGALRRLTSSLAARLMVILTVALLPIGLIALYQTSQLIGETRDLSESALLDRTQTAAESQRTTINVAFGAAETLAATRHMFARDETGCRATMSELVADSDVYTFAGYASADRTVLCSSDPSNAAFAQDPVFRPAHAQPGRVAETVAEGPVTGAPAVVVRVPVIESETLQGYVSVAFPAEMTAPPQPESGPLVELVMFNAAGTLLSSAMDATAVTGALPQGRPLSELADASVRAFKGESRDGNLRDFVVVAIVPDTAYVLGTWQPERRIASLGMPGLVALGFPLLMWAVSVLVAYFGVSRLVIRHVRRLQRRMRLYSEGHPEFAAVQLENAPEELEEVAESFRAMASRVAENERRREEDLQEKTVLLKEVHHRVKNNLQLISSLISMQMRNSSGSEAERLLRRVQDRVMALSTIHRNLYMSRNLSMIRADELLEDILEQVVAIGDVERDGRRVSVRTRLDPVEVGPDQSVPLSLLLTEAATNAGKYCGAPPDGTPWIAVTLSSVGPRRTMLAIANSREPGQITARDTDGTGLGSSLIESFVSQLGGRLEIEDQPDRFSLNITFDILKFNRDAVEGDVTVPA